MRNNAHARIMHARAIFRTKRLRLFLRVACRIERHAPRLEQGFTNKTKNINIIYNNIRTQQKRGTHSPEPLWKTNCNLT